MSDGLIYCYAGPSSTHTHTHTASKATTGTLLPSTNSVTLSTAYRTGSAAHTHRDTSRRRFVASKGREVQTHRPQTYSERQEYS